jgi:FlaA1/EpsC-like NDP-sugar epimerase
MYEELFDESETMLSTSHDKIRVAFPQESPSLDELPQFISSLDQIIRNNAVDKIIPQIKKIVLNFKNPL